MALTKITGQVINTATDVTVGVLTVTDTLAVGGTVSVGGTLTYEDVTNIDSVGLVTARNGIVVGSGITLSKDGDIFATGITTVGGFQVDHGSSSNQAIDIKTTATSGATRVRFMESDSDKAELTYSHDNDLLELIGMSGNGISFVTNGYGNERVRITSAGKVNIGDTQMSSNLLNIEDGTAAALDFASHGTGGDTAYIGVKKSTGGGLTFGISNRDFVFKTGATYSSGTTFDSGTERFRITSAGKVGINSASPEAQLMVLQNSTVANSLSFKSAAGQIFRNEDSEFAFGLSNAAPYPLFIQGRDKNNSGKNVAINPLGGLILIGSEKSDYNSRLGNKFSIVGTTAYTGMSISNYAGTNASHAPLFDFNRSRGTSDQSLTAVVNGDKLGELIFRGANGSNFADACAIRSYAATPSGSNVDGRFEISTSQAGTMGVKLGISSEGYVTKPNHPATTAVGLSGAIDTGGEGTIVAVTFVGTISNNGNHYSTTTGKFTVPVHGHYHVSCGFLTRKGSAVNASHNAFIYKNGSGTGIKTRDINSANELHITAVGIVDCNKGDELQVYVSNAGGDFWSDFNYFNVHLIG